MNKFQPGDIVEGTYDGHRFVGEFLENANLPFGVGRITLTEPYGHTAVGTQVHFYLHDMNLVDNLIEDKEIIL